LTTPTSLRFRIDQPNPKVRGHRLHARASADRRRVVRELSQPVIR
jgi:hypothetical protein